MELTVNRTLPGARFAVLVVAVLSLAVASSGPVTGQPRDPGPRTRFTVEIDGLQVGRFADVSGIGLEVEVVEFRDGGSNEVRKVPGRMKWPNVILKRALTRNTTLYDWAMALATTGTVVRRAVYVTVVDGNDQPIRRFHLENAWPAKWEVPQLKASGNEVALESIELAHEGLSVVDVDQ